MPIGGPPANRCDRLATPCSDLFSRPGVEESQAVNPDLPAPHATRVCRPSGTRRFGGPAPVLGFEEVATVAALAQNSGVSGDDAREDAMTADAKGEYRGLAWRNDAQLKAWLGRRPR